jgi:hypothetical protein
MRMLPAGDRRAQGGAVMKRFKVVSHRLDVKDPTNLVGLVSESHVCIDCGFNTAPRVLNRRELEKAYEASDRVEQWVDERSELFIVYDAVWKAAGMEPYGGCLCVGCLEQRLGRALEPKDFDHNHDFNRMPGTRRLRDRRGDK